MIISAMARHGLINIVWKNTTAFLHGKRCQPGKSPKKETVNLTAASLAEEAPLFIDGASNYMRLLQDPFFN